MTVILGQGLRTIALGIVAGVAGALAALAPGRALLFDVRPTDPLPFGAVIVMLAAVAALACYLPARRGTASTRSKPCDRNNRAAGPEGPASCEMVGACKTAIGKT